MKKPGSILRIKHFSDSEEEAIEEGAGGNGSDDDIEMEQSEDEINQSEGESEPQEPGPSARKVKPLKLAKKIRKKGIIYISSIPEHMNVAMCRELMECFGEVGRIFLQPDSKGSECCLDLLLYRCCISPYAGQLLLNLRGNRDCCGGG